LAKEKTKEVFGKLGRGSRVFVSHPYKHQPGDEAYNLRVWGFTDENVAEKVKKELQNIFDLHEPPEYTTGQSLIRQVQQENREGREHDVR